MWFESRIIRKIVGVAGVAGAALALATSPSYATPFDTAQVNGAVISAMDAAFVTGVNDLGSGNYSVDSSAYDGAISDFWGPVPSGNVVSVTLAAFNPTLAPGIITFDYTYGDGSVVTDFGGEVLAWNANEILVEVIDGFVPINQAAGTYVGTLDPSDYLILGDEDLAEDANGGNGPTFPILFGESGSFSLAVPEPGSGALMLSGLVALIGLGFCRRNGGRNRRRASGALAS
jgi:hypothetical protein